jgi:hypothetical protein
MLDLTLLAQIIAKPHAMSFDSASSSDERAMDHTPTVTALRPSWQATPSPLLSDVGGLWRIRVFVDAYAVVRERRLH